MGDDSTKGVDEDKIVQGPKKWFDTFQKLSKAKRTKIKKVQADMLIIEGLTENIVIEFIEHLKEEGFNIESPQMMGDIRFITECVKATIMREVGYKHPLRDAINKYVKDTEQNDNN
jgi:hypothetical protein|tara:strand:- start:569 stop:916 length:348 start_codon:yes stop_codon:yes gene_type:complete